MNIMNRTAMSEINHRVGISASAAKIYALLTTDVGLSEWWTAETTGAGDVGSVIAFRFNGGGPDFAVTELIPNQLVRWQHSGNTPADWMGTDISFYLSEQEGQTIVRFAHSGWQEVSDFLAHCSTKWAVFLLSLKDAAETGQGKPFPNDIHIDHS